MKRKGQHYISVDKLSLSQVFDAMDTTAERMPVANGKYTVNLKSDRLKLFKVKGVTCVCCGLKGEYFSAEKSKNGNDLSYHLNLYSADGTLMTKDHIVPRSKGGFEHISNFQTMCSPCNGKKGDEYVH